MSTVTNLQTATLGGGCFWCVEAVFQNIKGVKTVTSGYSGGRWPDPSYREVSYGRSGHAEVVQVVFDPTVISFEDILRVFFTTHDPTSLNRQGNDRGTQYRSVVFYHNEEQKASAEKIKEEMKAYYENPIVTEISEWVAFYKAEDYHQNYFNDNSEQPYCRVIISPKLAKLRAMHADKLAASSIN